MKEKSVVKEAVKEINHAKAQAESQLESILEMVETLENAGDNDEARDAAPELLEACRQAMEYFSGHGIMLETYDKLKSAISKAEGK